MLTRRGDFSHRRHTNPRSTFPRAARLTLSGIMGLLKNMLTVVGFTFTLAGAGLTIATEDTVSAVYGAAPASSSLFAFTTRGTFELGFGALLVLSRNWGSEERFKIGVVSLFVCVGLLFNFSRHADSGGMEPFSLTHPAYGGTCVLAVGFLVALVLNRMEPGIFESDKKSKSGTRKSSRTRPKRA